MRFSVEARDVPVEQAARRLGLNPAEFEALLPELAARGFPKADATTGHFDLVAIDAWCNRRHPELFLSPTEQARDARGLVAARLERWRKNG